MFPARSRVFFSISILGLLDIIQNLFLSIFVPAKCGVSLLRLLFTVFNFVLFVNEREALACLIGKAAYLKEVLESLSICALGKLFYVKRF